MIYAIFLNYGVLASLGNRNTATPAPWSPTRSQNVCLRDAVEGHGFGTAVPDESDILRHWHRKGHGHLATAEEWQCPRSDLAKWFAASAAGQVLQF